MFEGEIMEESAGERERHEEKDGESADDAFIC